jgi:hypothetical protein
VAILFLGVPGLAFSQKPTEALSRGARKILIRFYRMGVKKKVAGSGTVRKALGTALGKEGANSKAGSRIHCKGGEDLSKGPHPTWPCLPIRTAPRQTVKQAARTAAAGFV